VFIIPVDDLNAGPEGKNCRRPAKVRTFIRDIFRLTFRRRFENGINPGQIDFCSRCRCLLVRLCHSGTGGFHRRRFAQPSIRIGPSVNLAQDNFVPAKTNVVGRRKRFSLLGLIPIHPARLTKASDRLYANAELQLGTPRILADLIIEHSGSYWILFSFPEVIVRADVVQFNPVTAPDNGTKPAPGKGPGDGR